MLCLLSFAGIAFAQKTARGVVISSEDGTPVVGAYVVVNGNSTTGTITDTQGKFSLMDIPASASTLHVSCVGMKDVDVAIESGEMTISLAMDTEALGEAVVVGYGSARRVGTIIGSVATVNSEKLKDAPSSSALDALQGEVAGLSVLSSSGTAGDNSVSITLHGIGSLGASSTPLYVIDGIPSSSRTIMAMNPNDIKSITVLKDASATSIYGSRAANGVIYVTTKNGSFNEKATITVRSQYGWSTLADMSLYKDMMSGDELYQFWLDAGIATAEDLKTSYDDKGYRYNTKWYKVFQQFNNPQTQNDITFEGGGKTVSYLVSASQFHQRGTAIGNYYDRYTVRTNINAVPKTWIRFGVNANLSFDKRQRNANWGDSENMSNYTSGGLSYLLNPLYPHIDPETGEEYQRYPSGHWNPHYYTENNPNVYKRYGLAGNAYVEISPIKGLKLTSRVGTDLYFTRRSWMTYPSYIPAGGSGTRGRGTIFGYSNTITNTIEYNFKIAQDHEITVLGGHEGVRNNYDYYYGQSQGQYDDRLMNLQNGKQTSYTMSEEQSASRFLSFFGRIDYNYLSKYFVDFSLRNDASSRFGKDNRNATFWAAGFMWKMKNEDFMQSASWLDDLSFKVSYGTQGNAAIGDYSSLKLYSRSTNYNENPSLYFSQPLNADLTWEKQKLLTVGLTGRVLNMIDLELSYYIRKTSDMLMDVPYPYTSGFSSVTRNVGSMKNSGIDVRLGVDILRSKDYFLRFNTTFNYNKQKVTELFDGRQRWEIANTMVAYVVDSPVMFYLPIYAGVDDETGAPMWYKAGDDVDEKTTKETTTVFDEASLTQNSGKKRYAPINGGFGISAGWKGITLAADFSYVLGKYLVNNDAFFYDNPWVVETYYNQRKDVRDFWTEDNKDAKYPAWGDGYTLQFDTHLLENASFLRLKNLQVGYQLPSRWLDFQNVINGVKVSFTGRNLFTVTGYDGIDPEVNSNLTYGVQGNSKQYLFGIEVTF